MKREKTSELLGKKLKEKGWNIAVAESMTGGLLGDRITSVPGSSVYFPGGVIAYSDRVKSGLLKVSASILRARGAVSAEAALAMARGVRRTISSEVGVGLTGIAGPGGGSLKKPVGLAYCAVVTPEGEEAREFHFRGTRQEIKRKASASALKMILASLSRSEEEVLKRQSG